MKLHLPKRLLTALLAAFTVVSISTPCATQGMTLTDGYHKTLSLSESWSYTAIDGNTVKYNAASGKFTGYDLEKNTLTLNMQTSWTESEADHLICVDANVSDSGTVTGKSNVSVGLYANGNGTISGSWSGSSWNAAQYNISSDTLTSYGQEISLTVAIAKAEYAPEEIINGVRVFNPDGSNNHLYNRTDLRGSNTTYNGSVSSYLNSNLIDAIVVKNTTEDKDSTKYYASNFSGSWAKQFGKNSTLAVMSAGEVTEVTSSSDLSERDAIVVGGASQLRLNAAESPLVLNDGIDLYIGRTSYKDSNNDNNNLAAIRFDNTNNVTVNGDIYIVDNATLLAAGSSDITIAGKVTDKVEDASGNVIDTASQLTLKGSGYNFTGEVDVHGLHIAAGAQAAFSNLKVDSTLTNNGTLVLNSTVRGSGTVTSEQGRIELGAYTLNLFDVTYVNGGDSGFVDSLTVFSNQAVNTGKVYVDNVGYDVNKGTIILGGASKTYYVNEANHTATDDAADATAFCIAENASLNRVTEINAVIVGNGVYNLGANSTLGSLSLDDKNWKGAVQIGGTNGYYTFSSPDNEYKADLNYLDKLVMPGSRVILKGVKGWVQADANPGDGATISANIELENLSETVYAWSINDGYSKDGNNQTGRYTKFTGNFSGSGDIVLSKDRTLEYRFYGDLRGWTGNFMVENTSGIMYLSMEEAANTINAGINKKNGSIYLTVNTTDAATFSKAVTVNTLTLNTSATFEKALTTGTATIAANKTLTLGGGTADAMTSHSIGILNANGGSLTLTDYANLTIDTLKVNHTLSINQGTGVALNISSLDIQEGAVLEAAGDGSIVYFASQDALEGSANGNGYQATREMVLIKGYEWTGTQDNVSSRNGNTYLTPDDYVVLSSIYYVQQGTVTLGGTPPTAGVADATGFNVSKGATLAVAALPSGWSTEDMLTGKVTGEGRIQFASEVTVNHTDSVTSFGGELEVMGRGTVFKVQGEQNNYVNLTSLSNLIVNNGAQITYHATPDARISGDTTPHLQKISVENGTGTFHFEDSSTGNTLYIGEVSIHAGAIMTMTSSWQDSPITIQKLTTGGEGTDVSKLEVYSPGGNSPSSGVVNIQSLKDFSGELIFIKNSNKSLTATVNTGLEGADFKSLMVTNSNGTMGFTFNVQGDTSIDLVSLDSGTVTIYEGKTLTLGNGEVASTHNIGTLNAREGACITLNTGATLNAFTKGTGTVTLKGSGIYNLGSNASSNVSGLDKATWTGTVKLTDATLTNGNLSTWVNSHSRLDLTDITLSASAGADDVLTLNSSSGGSVVFNGNLTGVAGNLVIGGTGYTVTFNNGTPDWSGRIVADTTSGKLIYHGGETATVIENGIQIGGGNNKDTSNKLDVEFVNTVGMLVNGYVNEMNWVPSNGIMNLIVKNKDANASGGVQFNGTVGSYGKVNMAVEENASAEFTNASVNLNTVDVKEGATLSFAALNAQSVTNSGTLNLGEAASITRAERTTAATMTKVQMSSAGISSAATDSTKGSISNALIDLQKATEFSISDMSLSNVSLKAAATGTELNLNNVTAEAVQLAAGQFTLGGEVALSEQTPATKSGGYTASFTTDQLNGITLNNANGAATLTVDLGELPDCLQDGKTYNITIALSGFSMAAYDGTGLLFAADSWLGRMLADQNAVYVNADDVETATTLAANNNTVTVKYAAMTGGNVGTIITITGLTIPEPTTSTLGLVALAALVTRRRRK